MERITVGLDFGTHQTKICIENKSDAKNPIYSFFAFNDMDGNKNVILPSIVQINKDNTLSYGFVDKNNAKYGKKFFIGGMPEYPKRHEIKNDDLIPEPPVPSIFSAQPPKDELELIRYTQNLEKAKKSYETQITLWKQKLAAQKKKIERLTDEMEETYQNEIKEWYRWQNSSQTNHRMVYRYFKQSTFSDYKWNCKLSSSYLSVWYLSYIIFHLENKYGQNFAIQMGIPTGSDNFEIKKRKAVSLLLTAYHLVEEVFQNDLKKFLSTSIQKLKMLTTFVPYSEEKKMEYGLLVFPEAYAGLKSLTNQKKIENGMSLMVDIGGGTTDITFFTIEDDNPKIYDYSSIPFGINYIAETALPNLQDKFEANIDLNKIDSNQLNNAVKQYYGNLINACDSLVKKLRRNFEKTGFPINKLTDALKNRIVIYSGGGSTYEQLRRDILTFSDVKHMSNKIWEGMTIDEINSLVSLCPILSTSLGLSISEASDNVQLSTTEKMFSHLEGQYIIEEKPRPKWV